MTIIGCSKALKDTFHRFFTLLKHAEAEATLAWSKQVFSGHGALNVKLRTLENFTLYLRNRQSVNLRAIESCVCSIRSIERNMMSFLRTVQQCLSFWRYDFQAQAGEVGRGTFHLQLCLIVNIQSPFPHNINPPPPRKCTVHLQELKSQQATATLYCDKSKRKGIILYKVLQFLFSRLNWVPSHPFPPCECVSSQMTLVGGHTRYRGAGSGAT